MTLEWEGEDIDREAAHRAHDELLTLKARQVGEPLTIANEFSEVRVSHVETRNGARLLIESPKSGQWIALDPLELEAVTWQTTQTFSEMIARPYEPMYPAVPTDVAE
ncbi:hypothetical protein [Glutamicibacter mysorens]|uniref:hypothetical protein n=1 Tax=Glutamicibacter mysorens TaxID=257984 RepID=UPI0020C6A642|nr:hypothetical protein [Glutamicibacter mysorens]UTM45834.1 hypothetical protein XH9_09590 [Glutamicibacter mysorens]